MVPAMAAIKMVFLSTGLTYPAYKMEGKGISHSFPWSHLEHLNRVLEMGGMGDPPVPVGDSPTGKARQDAAESRSFWFETRLPFRPASRRAAQTSGLVPPGIEFSNTLRGCCFGYGTSIHC
jgi:hypothetical protein